MPLFSHQTFPHFLALPSQKVSSFMRKFTPETLLARLDLRSFTFFKPPSSVHPEETPLWFRSETRGILFRFLYSCSFSAGSSRIGIFIFLKFWWGTKVQLVLPMPLVGFLGNFSVVFGIPEKFELNNVLGWPGGSLPFHFTCQLSWQWEPFLYIVFHIDMLISGERLWNINTLKEKGTVYVINISVRNDTPYAVLHLKTI